VRRVTMVCTVVKHHVSLSLRLEIPMPEGGTSAQWVHEHANKHEFALTTDASGRVTEVREPQRGEMELAWCLRSLGNIVGMSQKDINRGTLDAATSTALPVRPERPRSRRIPS
jgi:hypothetical protein